MNIFCFAGNITKTPETRSTQSGKSVVSFSVAINEGKDKTEYVNCIAWEKTGELIAQYCKKGDRLSGSGRLQTRKYEDNNGNTRYVTEVVVTQFDFPPKGKSDPQDEERSHGMDAIDDELDDTIPFAWSALIAPIISILSIAVT